MKKSVRSEPKLLIVDDDEYLRMTYAAALRGAGYRVVEAGDGLEAVEVAVREQPALVLLDVDLPKANGWQTLERLRQRGFAQPVIMLTGLTQVDNCVRGFVAGAEDYLRKPCDFRELLVRVHAVLRRSQPAAGRAARLHFGSTVVDLVNRSTVRDGQAVKLTRTEYALLELFAQYLGQLVTRDLMLDVVWGYPPESNTRTVATHIWRLRLKLGDDPNEPKWIQSVPAGRGYRMVCDEPAA